MRYSFAALIGRPFLEAILWIYGKLREQAYADIEGRHYQFRSNPIDIIEGPGSERWLLLSDVRRTVGGIPGFLSLRNIHPSGVRREADAASSERIEARTLVLILAKAQDLRTRRFSVWLRQQVIFPAERKAELGRHR